VFQEIRLEVAVMYSLLKRYRFGYCSLFVFTACSFTAAPTLPTAQPSASPSRPPTSLSSSLIEPLALSHKEIELRTSKVLDTKASYIAFLNCAKDKSEISAEAKAAIEIQIMSLNLIPDSTWAAISAQYSASLQTSYAAALASCSAAK
jgi:hypothetical protein